MAALAALGPSTARAAPTSPSTPPAPVRRADAGTDKKAALRLAKAAVSKPDVARETGGNALRFAAEQGASVGEITAGTGLSEDTVEPALGRA